MDNHFLVVKQIQNSKSSALRRKLLWNNSVCSAPPGRGGPHPKAPFRRPHSIVISMDKTSGDWIAKPQKNRSKKFHQKPINGYMVQHLGLGVTSCPSPMIILSYPIILMIIN